MSERKIGCGMAVAAQGQVLRINAPDHLPANLLQETPPMSSHNFEEPVDEAVIWEAILWAALAAILKI